MDVVQVMWLHTSGDRPVGIVKVWDEIEERWKFYIGTGYGRDLDEDVQEIMDWGQKFYDLGFLTEFADMAPPKWAIPPAAEGCHLPLHKGGFEGEEGGRDEA